MDEPPLPSLPGLKLSLYWLPAACISGFPTPHCSRQISISRSSLTHRLVMCWYPTTTSSGPECCSTPLETRGVRRHCWTSRHIWARHCDRNDDKPLSIGLQLWLIDDATHSVILGLPDRAPLSICFLLIRSALMTTTMDFTMQVCQRHAFSSVFETL
jgi:hypothetical protein